MKDVMGIESRFEFNKAIGAGLAKEINALYNDGGHGRLTLPIGVCSAPSCWSPWAVSADRRHLQGVELSGEVSGNLDGDKLVESLCFILEHILQSLLEEPLVGRFLHLNEVGHIDYFFDFAKAHSLGVAKLYGFDIYHRRITP